MRSVGEGVTREDRAFNGPESQEYKDTSKKTPNSTHQGIKETTKCLARSRLRIGVVDESIKALYSMVRNLDFILQVVEHNHTFRLPGSVILLACGGGSHSCGGQIYKEQAGSKT